MYLSRAPNEISQRTIFSCIRLKCNLKLLTVHVSRPALTTGLAPLVWPPIPLTRGDSESAVYYSCPTLDTFWTSLESSDEIAVLDETLTTRASLGSPSIRRFIVSVRYSSPPDSDELPALHAIEGVEEVIVMQLEMEASSALTEVDWMVRLPERCSLPLSVHRDWLTVWGPQN